MTPSLTPESFVAKWKALTVNERQGSQTHFNDLCRLLGVPAPYDVGTSQEDYLFDAVTTTAGSHAYVAAKKEKARKGGRRKPDDVHPALWEGSEHPEAPHTAPGGSEPSQPVTASRVVSATKFQSRGFADVWYRGHFCWEYKKPGGDLDAALAQLRTYRDSLDNPPLLVVCDVDHYEIHTNFTGYPTERIAFSAKDLAAPPDHWRERGISPLELLRRVWLDPESFKPKKKITAITEERAEEVAALARLIGERKLPGGKLANPDAHAVAHFLMQVVFALFAEDVGLLPDGLVTDLIRSNAGDPPEALAALRDLFGRMEKGGRFGSVKVEWFNGGLFRNVADQPFPSLTPGELGKLAQIAGDDWSSVEPSILGTLFERALNPEKRSQIGAHYTSRDDIMLIVEPVILAPLRREWEACQAEVVRLIAAREAAKSRPAAEEARAEITKRLHDFHTRLAGVTVLDPACGSGNFLYVAIQSLLDLEKRVIAFGARAEVGVPLTPRVGPSQLRGIEINDYAAELARVSIWIGYLKWKRENGLFDARRPILDSLDTIQCRDAIVDRSDPKRPKPAEWPDADFIIGNPPFLGSKLFRKWGMRDDYLDALFGSYDLPKTSDLCCYWFELARRAIKRRKGVRAGLLATQGIRGGDNRTVLERIKETGDIFMAWSDREWVLDGAAVRVSMVGFDDGQESARVLDGTAATRIEPDLSDIAVSSTVVQLLTNKGLSFQGPVKVGDFDVNLCRAIELLSAANVNGLPSSRVVRPWIRGDGLNKRVPPTFIIDFAGMELAEAAGFDCAFRHVELHVKSFRAKSKDAQRRRFWWRLGRSGEEFKNAVFELHRFIVTCQTAKHRIFSWEPVGSVPAQTVIVVARSDDYFFGVLHSAVHEVWSLQQGTQLESRPRYTPTSTFETFPLPWPPGEEPTRPGQVGHEHWAEISAAASELDKLREAWLNPPEWLAPLERQVDIKFRAQLDAVPEDVRPLVRRSAVMAEAAEDPRLKRRTLTNLYNERPAWLRLAHHRLDRAVLAAYRAVDPPRKGEPEGSAWDPQWADAYEPFGAGEIVLKAEGKGKDTPELAEAKRAALAHREAIDAKILARLLRLNGRRAGRAAPGPVPTRRPASTRSQ